MAVYMSGIVKGARNLITDVEGLNVGNAEDFTALTGVTVLLPQWPVVASCDVRGGAPGTRDTDALDPSCLVTGFHGFVLAGGSVFGLDAASSITNWLAQRGVGFSLGPQPLPVPVVPSAILFDLTNGGRKTWGMEPPYRGLGLKACEAAGQNFALGNAGAGLGALAGRYKGGLGSASTVWNDYAIGALVAVNSMGSPVVPGSGDLWAADYALGDEMPRPAGRRAAGATLVQGTKFELIGESLGPGTNTTIAIIATDAVLAKAEAKRIAIMAHDGMARAARPAHTPFDGDTVFALATGRKPLAEPRDVLLSHLGSLAADTLARAIGRAIWEASSIGPWKSYRDTVGHGT
jgi:L-aminopeptidase/D-esterase-like protein